MGKRKQSNKKPQNSDKVASRGPAMTKPSDSNNNDIDLMTEKQKNDLLKKLLQEQSKATATAANGNDDDEEEEPKKKKAKEVSSSSEADEFDEVSSEDGGDDDDGEEKKEDDAICGSETPSEIFPFFCPADKLFYKTLEDVDNATERFNENNNGGLCGSKTPSKTHMFFCPADKMFYKTLEDVQKATDRFNNNKKQDDDDEDSSDDDMDPVGQEEQSPTHMYYCTGDGLFYRTHEDMAKAKKRSNQKRLQTLGLDKASADMRAVVTSSKRKTNKKRPPTKKKQGTSKAPVRRSTRPSIPVIAPLPPPSVNTLFEGLEDEDADYDDDDDDTSKQSQEDNESNESGRSEEDDGEVDGGENDDKSDEDDDMESGKADRWTLKYQEMKIFHKEKGHCKVPRASNKALGLWVRDQRKYHRLFNEGKKSHGMTQARIDKLNKIGFYWGKARSAPPVAWETRFNELKDHYEIFGDCDIDMKPRYADCSPLAKWIRVQRSLYHHLKKGRRNNNTLTKERIQKLKGLGFDWNGPHSTK